MVVLAQYLKGFEEFRTANIVHEFGKWYWVIDGKTSAVKTMAPRRLGKDA